MKNVNATLAVVVALGAVTMLAQSTRAEVILPSLPPGSQYQLIFVTSGGTTAQSSNIADYNTFVTNQAALGTTLPSATWRAIASTPTVNARDNAPTYPTVPIYDTRGDLIATGYSDLWDGDINSPIQYDQNGSLILPYANVWTGSVYDGSVYALNALGDTWAASGISIVSNGGWINKYLYPYTQSFSLYALSSPITVPTPEPGTLTLLGSALLGLAGVVYVRRGLRFLL